MLSAKQNYMPTNPKGKKRPIDPASNAVHVMRIATGQINEATNPVGKNEAAAQLGKLGGRARAKALTPQKRKQIAKDAAAEKWSIYYKNNPT